jgi:pimeloyl-ACP methyl ester carboxylesterase
MSIQSVVKLAVAAGAALGGAAVANATIAAAAPPLEEWLEGEKNAYFWRGRKIAYTTRGVGKPVVLVHGIHAAASSYEWRRNIDRLSSQFRVYAPDLLGFGHSDRPDVEYTAEAYVSLISDFIRDVIAEPASAVASSLACAYAVEAAYRTPQRFDRLVLVCPTGIGKLDQAPGPFDAVVLAAMRAPIVGEALYNVLASEASIRYYLENQVFADPNLVDDELVRQMYATSHQRNARFAPAAFLGGALNLDISEPFGRLTTPSFVIWGARARMTPAEDAIKFAQGNPHARVETVADAGLLPHEEKANWFNEAVVEFLE